MKANGSLETGGETAQEGAYDFVRKALAMEWLECQRIASFGKIGVLLIPLALTSACRGVSTTSVQKTRIGDASSTSAVILPKEKIVLRDVLKRDSSGIRPDSKPVLDEAIELLKNQPDMKVYVDSSRDPTGEEQLNLRLSRQRAATVTAYLERHGIASDRLIPRGFGATHFVSRNDTANGRLQNRRVELVLSR